MLANLVDLALHALSVMWLLFIGLIIYTGWFRDRITDRVSEVHELRADSERAVPVLTARSA